MHSSMISDKERQTFLRIISYGIVLVMPRIYLPNEHFLYLTKNLLCCLKICEILKFKGKIVFIRFFDRIHTMKNETFQTSDSTIRIALAGGGTGGHVFPLQALALAFRDDPSYVFSWIGEEKSLEMRIAHETSIPFSSIRAGKLRRYLSLRTIIEPFRVMLGVRDALAILWRDRIDLVFSKGGYVSLPVAIAARKLGIPVILHESDAIPGLANRLVARFARTVLLGMPEAKKYFRHDNVRVVGQILNPELFVAGDPTTHKPYQKNLLVTTGSQGSSRIFEWLLAHMSDLDQYRITVLLGTLNTHYRERFATYQYVRTIDFADSETTGRLYRESDVAVSRAGATTLAQLRAFDVPTLIIPLPESGQDHQRANARAYTKHTNMILVEEKNLEAHGLEMLRSLTEDSPTREIRFVNPTDFAGIHEVIRQAV